MAGRGVWIAAAAAAAIVAGGGAWYFMGGPGGASAPKRQAVNIVPAGGETITDVNPKWTVTLPAGWRWKVNQGKSGPWIRAINATAKDAMLNAGLPSQHGDVLCQMTGAARSNLDGKTQAELNKIFSDAQAENEAYVKKVGDPKAREVAFAELRDVKGVTVRVVLEGEDAYQGMTDMEGSAVAFMPGTELTANCFTTFKTSEGGYAGEAALKELTEVIRSFGPQ